MRKKIKTLMLLSSVVASIVSTSSTEGLYTGLSFGQTFSSIDLKRTLGQFSDLSEMSNNTPNAGTFIGYNHLVEGTPVLVGLEFAAQNHTMTHEKKDNVSTPYVNYLTKASTNNSMIGFVRMGVVINDMLFYGKIGVVKTNWTLSFKDKSESASLSSSSRKLNSYGMGYGFGIDFSLNKHWAVGVDYKVSDHTEMKLSHDIGECVMTPTLHTSTLRLIYSF